MGKIKERLLSDTPCIYCNELYNAERAKSFPYCIDCTKRYGLDDPVQLPIIEMHKQAPMVCRHETASDTAKQINPKRAERWT